MRRGAILAAAAAVPLSVGLLAAPAAMAATGGGNSTAAHRCQDDGYLLYTRSDSTAFANSDDCTSYAARGGTLTDRPTVSISLTPVSFDTRYCALIVTLQHAAPLTTYTSWINFNGTPTYHPTVTTDATGTVVTQVTSLSSGGYPPVSVTVDGVTSPQIPVTC